MPFRRLPTLPVEIWIQILSYLPPRTVRKLITINRCLFQLALDDIYGQIDVMFDDEKTRVNLDKQFAGFTRLPLRSLTICVAMNDETFPTRDGIFGFIQTHAADLERLVILPTPPQDRYHRNFGSNNRYTSFLGPRDDSSHQGQNTVSQLCFPNLTTFHVGIPTPQNILLQSPLPPLASRMPNLTALGLDTGLRLSFPALMDLLDGLPSMNGTIGLRKLELSCHTLDILLLNTLALRLPKLQMLTINFEILSVDSQTGSSAVAQPSTNLVWLPFIMAMKNHRYTEWFIEELRLARPLKNSGCAVPHPALPAMAALADSLALGRRANIFGTEQDRVNCSFYYKIGACRHGDRCSRKHIKPPFSQTILLPNVYHNPAHDPVCKLTEKELQEGFDAVYEDLYCELAKFGHLLELHVCDNVGDHLIGNVYARYEWETEAQAAVDSCNERWYAGRPLYAELSPVTDFREACCRQNENGECNRGGFCNFMHLRLASADLVSALKHGQRLERKLNPPKNQGGAGGWEPSKREGGRGRSASPSRRSSNPGEDRWTRK
ncbi:hypothetical protein CVT24_004417 [Panaeolus cyanescens]|uniref:F-box domain-containing protein n=1 Tax=Panaeolus cyanescens TaxID=181874 RepID=A0A409VA07_9AGAR|nr:hypothetical protein CVT24_004417 [Panaeolus cyanescens]